MNTPRRIETLSPADVRERWPVLSVTQTRELDRAEALGLQVQLTVRDTFVGAFIERIDVLEPEGGG